MQKDISILHEAIIEELMKVRREKGYSHSKLADMAGIHRTAIGHLENKRRNPTLLTCLKIAKALDVDLSKVITSAK